MKKLFRRQILYRSVDSAIKTASIVYRLTVIFGQKCWLKISAKSHDVYSKSKFPLKHTYFCIKIQQKSNCQKGQNLTVKLLKNQKNCPKEKLKMNIKNFHSFPAELLHRPQMEDYLNTAYLSTSCPRNDAVF